MKKLRVAYFGTPDFSAYFLGKLLGDKDLPVEVKLVMTQRDKPAGRKQEITPSPVKTVAKKYNIEIIETSNFLRLGIPKEGSHWSQKNLTSLLRKVDLALVYAYGEIIPKVILDLPKYGFWNIHPSLLPKYRGAAPVAGALINGEKETGVSIIKMNEKMDQGPIIAQEKLAIEPKERRTELTMRLTDLAYDLFVRLLPNFLAENWQLRPQDHSKATYTKLLKKDDGYIPFKDFKLKIKNSPEEVFNLFRGLYPWPGIWTLLPNNKRLKIMDVDFEEGKLIIKKVQLEGKKEVDFKTFDRAYNLL